jgi:urease accessory protein
MSNWLVWQFLDSSFPAGGYTQAAGLEAACRSGKVSGDDSLEQFLRMQLHQWSHETAPLAVMVHRDITRIDEAEILCDKVITHFAENRASRTQGKALLTMAADVFSLPALSELRDRLAEKRSQHHFAPIFGAVAGLMGVGEAQMRQLFVFTQLRGAVSAGVRLGMLGSMAADALQRRLLNEAELVTDLPIKSSRVEESPRSIGRDLPPPSPMIETFQTRPERGYSRLFYQG